MGYVKGYGMDALTALIAGLVREGVTFKVTSLEERDCYWTLHLTGGY